jgi:hypothetical protein
MLLCATRDAFLVHVMNMNFMVRACDFPDHLDGLLAGCAAGAVDFNSVFLVHNPSPCAPVKTGKV